VAEEEMVRLWVVERPALHPQARLEVLEPAQLGIVLYIRANLLAAAYGPSCEKKKAATPFPCIEK